MLRHGHHLVRIYDPNSLRPAEFCAYGPRHRFDHHRGVPGAPRNDPNRRIYYAADDLKGCLVEVFGDTGLISVGTLRIVRVRVRRGLRLLDLRGDGALRCGSVAALAAAPDRPLSQLWARWFYGHPKDFGKIDGISYPNAHNQDIACALFERAENAIEITADLALSDPLLRAPIRAVAEQCNLIVEPY
jgi:RES domain